MVSILNVTNTSNGAQYPAALFDLSLNFTEPLFIFKDNQNSKVGFYGTWTVGEGYNLTMQNPVTLADGDKVPIVDVEAKQADADLTLSSIDTEKFSFKGTNLNTTTASIKVTGKNNKVNSLVYAIA